MNRNVIAVLACWAVFGLSGTAFSGVIDFDDLVGNDQVPNGYGGVADWSGWGHYGTRQFPYSAHSAPNRVYDWGDGVFHFGVDVFFDGAWFAGHDTVQFQLYLDGDLVHTSGTVDNMSDGVVRWLDSGYAGAIDKVKVVATPAMFVMDDVTYNFVGDLDGDGSVGTPDLLFLLGAWGDCPPKGDCPADLDGDNLVSAPDLLILLGNWTVPPH